MTPASELAAQVGKSRQLWLLGVRNQQIVTLMLSLHCPHALLLVCGLPINRFPFGLCTCFQHICHVVRCMLFNL